MSNEEARQPQRTLPLGAQSPVRPPRPEAVELPTTLGAPRRTLGAPSARLAVPQTEQRQAASVALVERTQRPEPVAAPAPVAEPVRTAPLEPTPAHAMTAVEPESYFAPVSLVEQPGKARPEAVAAPAQVRVAARMHEELTQPLSELVQRRDPHDYIDMFTDLVTAGASDVHVFRSVLNDNITVKARLDGQLQEVHTYDRVAAQTLHTLLKTGSAMASGINRTPEDGTLELPINGYPYRARAASIPLFDGGEKLTFRLPQIGALRHLDDLGFIDPNLVATKELLGIPGGMILFAGPTGEGKSTTALSSLTYLRGLEDGVFITLEDPVERVIPGFEQVEVKEEIEGAGFGDMMKYIVRSDPNVLFIGEIRDRRTATAAVEIAKSGIRVLATIHAKDNISAFMRVTEMADHPPLSVLESVNGVISQRLVRRLVEGTDRFAGRYPIHEVTTNSVELTDALIANVSRKSIDEAAADTSTTFKQNVDALVAAGITTYAEARKVVRNV